VQSVTRVVPLASSALCPSRPKQIGRHHDKPAQPLTMPLPGISCDVFVICNRSYYSPQRRLRTSTDDDVNVNNNNHHPQKKSKPGYVVFPHPASSQEKGISKPHETTFIISPHHARTHTQTHTHTHTETADCGRALSSLSDILACYPREVGVRNMVRAIG
jgi:hypothetical protein